LKLERLIIGNILGRTDNLRLLLISNIDATYFFDDPESGMVYSFIVKHFRKHGKSPSSKFVRSKFTKYKIIKSGDTVESLIDEIRVKYKRSELSGIIHQSAELLEKGLDVDGIMLSKILELRSRLQTIDLITNEKVERHETLYFERATRGCRITGVPFNLETFDKVTLGIQKTDFVVVLARQKTGKTNFILWCISNWIKSPLKVLFIPLEGNIDLLEGRLICFYCGLNYWRWRAGALMQDEIQLFHETLKKIKNGKGQYMFVSGQQGLTPTALMSLQEEFDPDITVIDAAHKMKDDERSKQPYERCSNVSRSLSDIVSGKKRPIMVTWQINRVAPHVPPKLEYASYTDALGQDITLGIGLFKNSTLKALNLMQVDMLANREDEAPGIIMNWNLGRDMALSEAEEEFQSYYVEESDTDG